MGGAIFVESGGSITLAGNLTLDGSSVTGGAGGAGAQGGSAFGSAIFLQGSAASLTFSPGSNTTQAVRDVIADEAGSGGSAANSVGITKSGAGTLVLSGNNTYSGTTTISAGTLQVGEGGTTGSLGSGNVVDDGALVFKRSDDLTVANAISGSGSLTQAGTGTLTLTNGSNSYAGGTTISSGTLAITDGNALGTGAVTLDGGKLLAQDTLTLGNTVVIGTGSSGTIAAATGTTLTLTGSAGWSANAALHFGTSTDTGTVVAAFGSLSVTLPAASIAIDGGTLKAGNSILGNVTNYSTANIAAHATLDTNGYTFGFVDLQGSGNLVTSATPGNTVSIQAGNFAGVISGSDRVQKTGSGTLLLSGDNTYTGGTTVSGGTLQVGNGGTTGSLGTGNVVNDATLVFDRSNDFTVANAISGSGSVTKNGAGTLALTGANGYQGTTTINAGTLQLGDGGTTGTLGIGNVVDNSALVFKRSDTTVVANAISGAGTLTQAGSGTLVLSGANSYSGGTFVDSGTLRAGSAGALSAGSAMHVASGATLDLDGQDQEVASLAGAGNVTLGSGTLTSGNDNTSTAFSGVTSGTGGLTKVGSGTLTLAGANNYSGATTVDGGTLRAGAANTFSASSAVSVASGTTLDLAGYDQAIASLAGAGNVTLGTATLTAGDDNSSTTFSGAIGGTGGFTKSGTGTLTLAGASSYGGATTVGAGTLRAGAANTWSAASAVNVANGATLDLAGYDQAIASLAGAGNVTLGTATLTTGGDNASTSFAGTIGGTGGLTKNGSGTLILTGASGYGITSIHAGTLQVGAGGTTGTLGTGNVVDDATLVFNRSDDLTVANGISGTGALLQAGSGTLTLTGANSYGGTTTISAGALHVGSGGTTGSLGTGNVVNDTALSFNRSDATTVANAISGSGTVTQAGTGTLTLTGANSYGGTTIISAGTLQVGDGGTTGSLGTGNVVDNGNLVYKRSDDITTANAISGSGTLTQSGSGTLTLASTNSYTGGTVIAAGTLVVGAGGTLGSGAITNNGSLVFSHADTYSLADGITGTGSLTQAGGGNLVLAGSNDYSGGTFVNNGLLSVNGSITGLTTVHAGGTLGGNGTVGSVNVASGGVLAPGNSIGTLTVAGNLDFAAGSTYRVEANAAGASDRVNTVGAGSITLHGGTVSVLAGGAGYQRNTTYTILSSAGTTTGRFDSVTSNLAFLTPTLVYQDNAVLLNLLSSDVTNYASVARTANQRKVANFLNGFANTPGNATAAGLIQRLDNLSADEARVAFDNLSGSPHASASQIAGALGRNFSASLAARSGFSVAGNGNALARYAGVRYASLEPSLLAPASQVVSDTPLLAQAGPARGVETPLPSARERGLWVQTLGSGGRSPSDGNGPSSNYSGNGFVLGFDQPVDARWLAGGAVGYSRTQWDASTNGLAPASGTIESPQAGLYARYASDAWRLRFDGTWSDYSFSTDRTVAFGGTSATANSSHRGHELGLAAQAEMPLQAGGWELRPLAGVRLARLQEDGFTENGAGAANLAVDSRTTQNAVVSAGMHFVRLFEQDAGGLELRAVASRLLGDNDTPVVATLAGQSARFSADGTPLRRDALTLGATVSGQFSRSISGYLDAVYEMRGGGQQAYQFTAGVRKTW
nr:autotransporter-associated beta strand repeat-containing protein [Ramlibacter agri]